MLGSQYANKFSKYNAIDITQNHIQVDLGDEVKGKPGRMSKMTQPNLKSQK